MGQGLVSGASGISSTPESDYPGATKYCEVTGNGAWVTVLTEYGVPCSAHSTLAGAKGCQSQGRETDPYVSGDNGTQGRGDQGTPA